jgi:hypothetical protein
LENNFPPQGLNPLSINQQMEGTICFKLDYSVSGRSFPAGRVTMQRFQRFSNIIHTFWELISGFSSHPWQGGLALDPLKDWHKFCSYHLTRMNEQYLMIKYIISYKKWLIDHFSATRLNSTMVRIT